MKPGFSLPRLPALSLPLLLTTLTVGACAPADRSGVEAESFPYDLLITGGTVVDGTGEDRFRADVAVRGDRIGRVVRNARIPGDSAAEVLDAEGRIVAPGFIDNHAHIQLSIDDRPLLGRASPTPGATAPSPASSAITFGRRV